MVVGWLDAVMVDIARLGMGMSDAGWGAGGGYCLAA